MKLLVHVLNEHVPGVPDARGSYEILLSDYLEELASLRGKGYDRAGSYDVSLLESLTVEEARHLVALHLGCRAWKVGLVPPEMVELIAVDKVSTRLLEEVVEGCKVLLSFSVRFFSFK